MTAHAHHHDAWWPALEHGGMLIAPARLIEYFAAPLEPLKRRHVESLRRGVTRALDGEAAEHGAGLLDLVLEDILGLEGSRWVKGNRVTDAWEHRAITGERVRPRRIWLGPNLDLPVFVTDVPRLGVGRGRREHARAVEWLRHAELKLAALWNGRQLRLVYAGPDHDAWCQWDLARWFEEGAPGPQVTALRQLLGRQALVAPASGQLPPLLAAVLDSRKGQGELSAILGERVRQAVEHLIRDSSRVLDPEASAGRIAPRDIYIAATRLIMRMVVIFFAEARELLPQENPLYHASYGLQGLREELDRASGGSSRRLRHRHAAWPRLLGLFRLVYHGSAHEELPVTAYGGGLFEPGAAGVTRDHGDPVPRALAVFESPGNTLPDDVVHRIIELLTRTRVKVRQGRRSAWIEAPVDFSDLSSEYIGILYEGLLDFELRRAPADDAVVFLGIGAEPALPFSRLDAMTDKELARLFEKLREAARESADTGEDEAAGAEAEAEPAEDERDGDDDQTDGDDEDTGEGDEGEDTGGAGRDPAEVMREGIQIWAERAVKAARIVRYPRNDRDARVRERHAQEVRAAARKLVRRVALPGEWFLVRWGGTRKGSGTFYTRPQIAGPIVRRTLQPLAYQPVREEEDPDTGLVEVREWAPRVPEDILTLKVCDPAMGSGSFLIAALRYLTDALFESLHAHGRLASGPERTVARLADGLPADHPANETLPVAESDESFEERLRARLKRHLVERCLYGVDLDPVAVELARLSLWVETMDRELPFEFLDHKLQRGNALVGCWFDRFQDYPLMAWEREGGDRDHGRFVHHCWLKKDRKGKEQQRGDVWTQAIKDVRSGVIKPALARWITERRQTAMTFGEQDATAASLHHEARAVLEGMHDLPVHEAAERARRYNEDIRNDQALRELRRALDAWCALWFWPGHALDQAPTPDTLHDLPPGTAAMVDDLARRHGFFHWELAFPDVFTAPGAGFHAIVGNPPWETLQPVSQEFFSNIDPLYRTYGKQEALGKQEAFFTSDAAIEKGWIAYQSHYKALANWMKHAGSPFGDPAQASDGKGASLARGKKSFDLHRLWRELRAERPQGYAERSHPFLSQGEGKPYTYKMFLELGHALLGTGGRLGLLVPSGIYTDNGSKALRELFLDRCAWTHLYAFQNERFVFAGIHHSFKMAVVHVHEGGPGVAVLTRFRLGPGDSPTAQEIEDDIAASHEYLPVPRERIHRFSPNTAALLEIRTGRDLTILEKLYDNGVLLGNQGADSWEIEYRQGDFNMTSDSKLFPPRPQWEAKGYRPDEYGHWLKGKWRDGDGRGADGARDWSLVRAADGKSCIAAEDIDDVALPLYQGRMLHIFDYSAAGWIRGTGLRAVWEAQSWSVKQLRSQFLMAREHVLANERFRHSSKLGFRDIARSTDERTMIPAILPPRPCGHVVGILHRRGGGHLLSIANFAAFAFDWQVRERMGGTHLTWHILDELAALRPAQMERHQQLFRMAASLAVPSPIFAADWVELQEEGRIQIHQPWRRLWAITDHERLRLRCILDAVVAELYGLDVEDFAWILRDCDHPVEKVNDKPFSRTLDPKGFWRVDKHRPPELRHTVLSLVAFHELKQRGLDAFLALNHGDGWMLPETLRLADYGLGHDERARAAQPVAAALGPRFLDWQLAQGVDESWDECARHAALIEQIVPTPAPAAEADSDPAAAPRAGEPGTNQMNLFGAQPAPGPGRGSGRRDDD